MAGSPIHIHVHYAKHKEYIAEEIINNNRYYPSSYDRPHDFSVIANYHLNKRLRFSANFSYATGRPITLPENYYFNVIIRNKPGNDTDYFF